MRKHLIASTILLIMFVSAWGQSPGTVNYQAVARDSNGDVLGNQQLQVRIAVYQTEALVWEEEHTVSTSEMGFFSLAIGESGASKVGGSLSAFADIDWSAGDLQYQVSVDDGNGFVDLGMHDFHAVPYALFAASGPPGGTGSDDQQLSLEGSMLSITNGNSVDLADAGLGSGDSQWSKNTDTLSTMRHVAIGTSDPGMSTLAVQGHNLHPEAPLFEVRREDGFPVFAVYSDGVMVYVDEDAQALKGRKGGFAVGGYSRGTKGINQEYLSVTPDSVRIYVPEEEGTKGRKGSFSVGSYSKVKGISQSFLTVSPDSTRIYVPEDEGAKGRKGSFAVGSYSKGKGVSQSFLTVSPDSTRVYVPNKENEANFVGLQGGFAVSGYTEGAKGTTDYLMGINRGITRFNTTDSDRGFAIGSQDDGWGSNYLELTPTNSFIGTDAGLHTREIDPLDENGWGLSSMNVFVGYQTGMFNEYGHHNTFLGFCAGTNTLGEAGEPESAAHNTFLGTQSGFKNIQGSYNAYVGCYTGFENLDGTANVFIGGNAGFTGQHTSGATMVGNNAGAYYDGSGGVTFLGYYAGFDAQGDRNTMLGNQSGSNSDQGSDNVFVGQYAGQNATGDNNVLIGNHAGRSTYDGGTGDDNTAVGYNSGSAFATAYYNAFFGANSGASMDHGQYNAALGAGTSAMLTSGAGNVHLGAEAGYSSTSSSYNVFVGHHSGFANTTSGTNTMVGTYSGQNNTGSGNVFLGFAAGMNETTGSNQLYLDNTSTIDPLLWGSFTSDYLIVYGDLDVQGTLYESSDASLKTNIQNLDSSLDKLMSLKGVSFQWKEGATAKGAQDKEESSLKTSETSIGVLAQDVESVFPELVAESRNGTKAVNYSGLVPVLIEAVKEQQAQIEIQQELIQALEQRLSELER